MKYVAAIILIAVVFVFYKRENNYRNEIREHINRADNAKRKVDSLENELDLLIIHYRNISNAWRKAESERLIWEGKYNEARKKKTPVHTDAVYDSILNRLYPR